MPQNIPYDGYPAPGGITVKNDWKGDHFGPGPSQGNYQQGGYNLNAAALGMSRIEHAIPAQQSQSGNYFAKVFYPAISGNNEVRAIPPGYVVIKWYIAANSAEVANDTNLSAESTLLVVQGL